MAPVMQRHSAVPKENTDNRFHDIIKTEKKSALGFHIGKEFIPELAI